MNQRWRQGRTLYRPPNEVINTLEYEVATIAGDTEAKRFVATHHYSGSYPEARYRFGIYHKGALVGVAVFSVPCNCNSLTKLFPFSADLSAELGRFVLLDQVPGNGESWFLGRCFAVLKRAGLAGIISYSDPMPRRSIHGEIVFKGHIGTIYQAFNGLYVGRSSARNIHLLPDGSVFSARAIQKVRGQERGWKYAAGILQRFGADDMDDDPVSWLGRWLPILTRKVHHPGNHKYAWALNDAARRSMPPALPFPKFDPLFQGQHCSG